VLVHGDHVAGSQVAPARWSERGEPDGFPSCWADRGSGLDPRRADRCRLPGRGCLISHIGRSADGMRRRPAAGEGHPRLRGCLVRSRSRSPAIGRHLPISGRHLPIRWCMSCMEHLLLTENPCSAEEKGSKMTCFPPPGMNIPSEAGRRDVRQEPAAGDVRQRPAARDVRQRPAARDVRQRPAAKMSEGRGGPASQSNLR
jgi:hypothetical protein